MQSALQQPDLGSTKAANVAPTRIVTIDLHTYKAKQYLYLLDNPATTGDANSEITALSEHEVPRRRAGRQLRAVRPARPSTRSTSTAPPTSAG